MRHAFNKLPRRCGGVKLSIPVSCKAVISNNWTYYASMSEAAKALGINDTSVSMSCGRGTAVKGYHCQLLAAEDGLLEAEEWKQVMDPKSGHPVPGHVVSSFGRLKSRTAKIFQRTPKEGRILRHHASDRLSGSNCASSPVGCERVSGATAVSTAHSSQSQGWEQEQQLCGELGIRYPSPERCAQLSNQPNSDLETRQTT